jgi:hypothetical protein
LVSTNKYTHRAYTPIKELLPPRSQAEGWLRVFLCGPNTLMRICSPTETRRLLDMLYDENEQMSEQSECLIAWQLAVGSRFTANTDEHVYSAIYESALAQTEMCVEKDEAMPLWIVPTLLLRCVHQMASKPRNCWLTLGKPAISLNQDRFVADRKHS